MGLKEVTVSHLRQMMLDELQRRNYSPSTVRSYLHAVEDFSKKYVRRSPDLLGPHDIRNYRITGLPRSSLSDSIWSGVAGKVKSGAGVPADKIFDMHLRCFFAVMFRNLLSPTKSS